MVGESQPITVLRNCLSIPLEQKAIYRIPEIWQHELSGEDIRKLVGVPSAKELHHNLSESILKNLGQKYYQFVLPLVKQEGRSGLLLGNEFARSRVNKWKDGCVDQMMRLLRLEDAKQDTLLRQHLCKHQILEISRRYLIQLLNWLFTNGNDSKPMDARTRHDTLPFLWGNEGLYTFAKDLTDGDRTTTTRFLDWRRNTLRKSISQGFPQEIWETEVERCRSDDQVRLAQVLHSLAFKEESILDPVKLARLEEILDKQLDARVLRVEPGEPYVEPTMLVMDYDITPMPPGCVVRLLRPGLEVHGTVYQKILVVVNR
jgi:hypothetical protein